MKTIGIIIIMVLSMSLTSFGQGKLKFGHINSNDLLAIMPEKDVAQKAIQDYARQLENQLLEMQTELEKKYSDYLANQESYSNMIKQTKEEELVSLQQRIQNFQHSAQMELQKKEGELLQPIIDKAQKAIDDVSKENGYTYVFDTGTGALLYWPKDSDDILPLVKKKLGVN